MPIELNIPEIPHGHGLSFKKGVADGILDEVAHVGNLPNGHDASYRSGREVGRHLRDEMARLVRE